MEKIAYLPLLFLSLFAVSCDGTKEYDSYISDLSRQIEALDTVSSPEAFAARIDSVRIISTIFEQAGVKLNEDQNVQIQDLTVRLQKAFTDAYDRLAAIPVTLPDEIAVPD